MTAKERLVQLYIWRNCLKEEVEKVNKQLEQIEFQIYLTQKEINTRQGEIINEC